jgi:hypothetical protein
MHYCSILETLYEQKTIAHGFQQQYMRDVVPSLGNLAAKAGFAFFNEIKQSVQNFGLQSLLCHYLTSSEGRPIFNNIMSKISELHSYDFIGSAQEYGVFISGKDFASGIRFMEEHNPVLLGYQPLLHKDAAEKVSYADLCFLLKGEEQNLAVLGEVEGNHGDALLTDSFWTRKKGLYYSFGIGVKQRNTKKLNPMTGQLDSQADITGRWVTTESGYKYVVIVDSDHYVIQDFHDAIGTIQLLMTLGVQQRANYDHSLLPVLNMIKANWDAHILDLISSLRGLLVSNDCAVLGVNPLSAKVIPSIVT